MKVLVVSANRCKNPMPVMPLGACTVADAAARAGHDVQFFDCMFERNPAPALAREVRSFRPDVVGLSIRNIDNNDMDAPIAYYRDLPALRAAIRANTDAELIIGGAGVGVMPEALLAATGASWAALGPGETVFPEFLSAIERGKDPKSVPGIHWLEKGALRTGDKASAAPLDGCRVPDFTRWLNFGSYKSNMCTTGLQTKRGCPHKCVYCTYAITEGQQYALADPLSIVPAGRRLLTMGIRDVEFVDSVFNSPYDHAMAVCETFARARLGLRLHTVELNPAFVTDELLIAMEQAGFVSAGITAESASDRVLEGLGKGYKAADVVRASHAVRRSRIPFVWFFLMGGPGETQETIRETLHFAEDCIRPDDVAFFNLGIRIYPGTELESVARRQGILTVPRDQMLSPVFYFTPEVDRTWAAAEARKLMSERLNFIGGASINFSYLAILERLAHFVGVKPPLWRHTRLVRRMLRMVGMDPI
jgi:radical SAM superfamily enzyme YgiQ (UPF0313 family)